MISTTSMTSTIGVTLMSETGGGAFFNFISVSCSVFSVLTAISAAGPFARTRHGVPVQLARKTSAAAFYYLRAPDRINWVRFRK
jgi:hypothetical protein